MIPILPFLAKGIPFLKDGAPTILKVVLVGAPFLLIGKCMGDSLTERRLNKTIVTLKQEVIDAKTAEANAKGEQAELTLAVNKANGLVLDIKAKSDALVKAKEAEYRTNLTKVRAKYESEKNEYQNYERYMLASGVGSGLRLDCEKSTTSNSDSGDGLYKLRAGGVQGERCKLPEAVRVDLIRLASDAQAVVVEHNRLVRILNSLKK